MNASLETVAVCPLCGSRESVLWKTLGEWQLRRCAGCGLTRVDPRPGAAELTRLYDAAYFDGRVPQNEERAARQMARAFGRRLRLIRRFRKGGRLLDAGCGEGRWLASARQAGFEVHGFDLSAEAVARAKQALHLDVAVASIGDVSIRGPFDVITASHSLEHTVDPIEALRWFHSLVVRGGLLVVEVPNCESLDARKMGVHWRGWQPPVHLWHFNEATLREALVRTGFEPLAVRHESSSYARQVLRRIPVLSLARGALAHLWSGTSVTMAARA
jgi:SAM-dependent methyltransferase